MDTKLLTAVAFFLLAISIQANPIIVHLEDFNNCASVSWTNIAASADSDNSDEWFCNNTNGTFEANGFGGGNDEDWLVSPAINMDTYAAEYLTFDYLNDFSGADIELFYAVDFSGNYTTTDLENANWTAIPIDLYDIDADAYVSNFLPYAAIDISALSGTAVYFAFRYTATGNAGGSETWEIDNVRILANYYGSIPSNLNCADLKTALHNLIDNHDVIEYTSSEFDVWDSHYVTDCRTNDAGTDIILRDRYSDNPTGAEPYEYTHGVDRDPGGTVNSEGVYYNREHVFPTSWWGGGNSAVDTQFTDIHMIIPADKFVNQERSNFPMGEVASVDLTFENGSLLGASGSAAYTNTVFEPIDEYKGDIARIFFYMAVRYENIIANWENENSRGDDVLDGMAYTVYEDWFRDQLILWHNADPVSTVEMDRNNGVYAIQGNRNPFVDNPVYVNDVWGPPCFGLPVELSAFHVRAINKGVQLDWQTASELNNDYFAIQHSTDGRNFKTIAYSNGAGDSGILQTYEFTHLEPAIGSNYYRLEQFDFDGKSSLSEIRLVHVEDLNTILVYPNPVSESLYVNYAFAKQDAHVYLKDYFGRTICEIAIAVGSEFTVIPVGELPQGVYVLEVWSADQMLHVERFVKE